MTVRPPVTFPAERTHIMERLASTHQTGTVMSRSYVVTGGGRGIGRAVVERLLGDGGTVVAIELDPAALSWVGDYPAGPRVIAVVGDASDEDVAERAADLAQAAGTLTGWVNNAAVFRDASIHSAPTRTVLDLVAMNFFFSSRRRHTRLTCDWSSDVCSSD